MAQEGCRRLRCGCAALPSRKQISGDRRFPLPGGGREISEGVSCSPPSPVPEDARHRQIAGSSRHGGRRTRRVAAWSRRALAFWRRDRYPSDASEILQSDENEILEIARKVRGAIMISPRP